MNKASPKSQFCANICARLEPCAALSSPTSGVDKLIKCISIADYTIVPKIIQILISLKSMIKVNQILILIGYCKVLPILP